MLLQELFGIDNNELARAKKERIDKQYYIDFFVTAQEVKEGIANAESFTVMIREHIEKLTNEEKEGIRKEFEKMYL